VQPGGGRARLSWPSVSPFASGSPVLESFRDVVRYRNLLRDLIARDLKVRYKRSALRPVDDAQPAAPDDDPVNLVISLVPLALIMPVLGHPFSPALAFLPVPVLDGRTSS